MVRLAWIALLASLCAGCAAFPEKLTQPLYHNPFPQLHRIAIVPFFNQSTDPTLNGEEVALNYYNELQQIPGFEVLPVGVVKTAMRVHNIDARDPDEIRRLALILKVDAVVIGAITDYSSYYPPRMGLAVDWYATNPGFHPIPPGYGLPWGTPAAEDIPSSVVRDAEFALAREQLKTQTPPFEPGDPLAVPARPAQPGEVAPPEELPSHPKPIETPITQPPAVGPQVGPSPMAQPPAAQPPGTQLPVVQPPVERTSHAAPVTQNVIKVGDSSAGTEGAALNPPAVNVGPAASDAPPGIPGGIAPPPEGVPLPKNWPDPRGFVPPPPCAEPPPARPQREPVLSHIRIYNGHDSSFTEQLSNYYEFRDEARFGGWQGYLQRQQDFTRFCCYLHITEMLAARGGTTEKRVVWRWPFGRYLP